jgi:hypothetical protein
MSTPIDLDRTTGMISEGTHLFRIETAEEKASTSSGNPTWYLGLICQDQGEDQGKKMLLALSLSVGARFKIDQLLDAIEAPKKGTWTVEQCAGKLLKICVTHGEYNGQPKMDAYRMLPASSTAVIPLPERSTTSSPSSAPELTSAPKTPFGLR